MKTTLQLELARLLDQSEFQTTYSHQISDENQLHSQLLNYYGLNRLGTGKWFSLGSTHLRVFHQNQQYHHYHNQNEKIRTYQVTAYSLLRSPQVETFISNLATADGVFAQQLEQLGTPSASTHHRQQHLLDLIDSFYPDLFNQLSICDHQKAKAEATRVNACYAPWQPGVFIGIAPQALSSPPGKDSDASNTLSANALHAHTLHDDTLVIGVTHAFALYSNWVSERDLAGFFDGYAINSKPAFALSLPLLPLQYQLWKQLLPKWLPGHTKDSRSNARFHFYHRALATDVVSDNANSIVDKAIAFNYSLDRIIAQHNKQIVSIQPVNTRISTLTWSDGTTDENVFLAC